MPLPPQAKVAPHVKSPLDDKDSGEVCRTFNYINNCSLCMDCVIIAGVLKTIKEHERLRY